MINALRHRFLGGCLALLALSAGAVAETDLPALGELLPTGKVTAIVLDWQTTPRAEVLMGRFTTALQQHPEWFKQYVNEHHAPGKELPWHPNFGLTEAEYAELLAFLTTEMGLVEVGRAELAIGLADGVYTLHGSGRLAPLEGVQLDTRTMRVSAHWSGCGEWDETHVEPGQARVEAWDGFSWHCAESADPAEPLRDIRVVRVNIGRVRSSGVTFFTIKESAMQGGEVLGGYELALHLPAAGREAGRGE